MIGVMKSSTTWINTPTAFLILCLRLTPLIHAASSKRASDTRSDRKDLTILTQRTVTDDDPHSGTTRQRSHDDTHSADHHRSPSPWDPSTRKESEALDRKWGLHDLNGGIHSS